MTEPTLTSRFSELSTVLRSELFERSDEVHCALLALVSGTTLFMLGEPGIAKSLLIRRLAARIDGAEFFDLALDKFTVPDDLFGPRSLRAMKEDSWERVIDGTLVTADFAMLDEFFEANSALLKSLLRALNERTFRQGTEIIPMRLSTVFAASNEVPTDPRLAALYDRLLIRCRTSRIQDLGNFVSMLDCEFDAKPETLLSWTDVLRAQVEAAKVKVPNRMLMACGTIRLKLAEVDVQPSDRRFRDAMRVVRANAWLDGSVTAEPEHLRCLADILWHDPEEISKVAGVVEEVLEPLVSEADMLLRRVEELRRQVRTGLEESQRKTLANELHDKLTRAKEHLADLRQRSTGNRSNRQVRRLDQIDAAIEEVSARILTDLYLIDLKGKKKRSDVQP